MKNAFANSLLTLFFSCVASSSSTAQEYSVVKDFKKEWRVFQHERYELFSEKSGRAGTIYFSLEANKFPKTFLRISSPDPFTLFLNGQLAAKSNTGIRLSVDSLREIYPSAVWQVSIHQNRIQAGGLQTVIQSKAAESSTLYEPPARFSSFRDFAIIGMLVMMVMLIVITQLNPKLASDYFSVTKIFSVHEGEDSQAYSRITSSINILFYAYSSLMLGYYLMIVFHFLPAQYAAAIPFQSATFWEALVRWIELSLIVLGMFFLKILLVYGLSYVFGMREIGGIHFFNWVRLLLGVFGVLTIVLFLYFIAHGHHEGFYVFLLATMAWVLAGWMILVIFKLQRQMGHSMFHLFSYICATELIPFLITIKVLYY
jgi:hypothetical protein